MKHDNRLVFLFGPTAVGKTELALRLARRKGEIISVDSMQVYQGFECGTAKPTAEQMKEIRHHLVSIVPPEYRFSAGDFKRLATKAISDIYARGKIPLLVGGTGLYFRALEYDLHDGPVANLELRETLYREEEKEPGLLYKRLLQVDSDTAQTLHLRDLVRVVRALEVYYESGIKQSDLIRKKNEKRYTILKVGITLERELLYRRIEERCRRMVECGLAEETYSLLQKGHTEKLPSMKGLGYSHFLQYFKGCYSYDEVFRLFIRDTRRYAKRQLTWFRKEEGASWYGPDDSKSIREKVEAFLNG